MGGGMHLFRWKCPSVGRYISDGLFFCQDVFPKGIHIVGTGENTRKAHNRYFISIWNHNPKDIMEKKGKYKRSMGRRLSIRKIHAVCIWIFYIYLNGLYYYLFVSLIL